jgi:hypothetical protein
LLKLVDVVQREHSSLRRWPVYVHRFDPINMFLSESAHETIATMTEFLKSHAGVADVIFLLCEICVAVVTVATLVCEHACRAFHGAISKV